MRKFGLRRTANTEQAKAIRKLDIALSKLVREHYQKLGCFTCGRMGEISEMDCGHFRRRELKATRFDLRNMGIQCRKCNRFEGGRPYEFARKINEIWGMGTAEELFLLSSGVKQWHPITLGTLTDAAKKGWLVYLQTYKDLES